MFKNSRHFFNCSVQVAEVPPNFSMFPKVPFTSEEEWIASNRKFPRDYTCSQTITVPSSFV